MGTQAQTAISKHPVTEWNKSTVADGTYLNDKTITPLRDRDVELAKIIDGLDTKFPNNQDLEELEIRVSENEDKIEDIKEDIGPTSARNLVVSIESEIKNLPPKKSGSVVNVRPGDSALIVRKSDDDEDVYKFESYVFESDEGNDRWTRDEELVDVYTKDGVDNLLDDFDALPDMTNANAGDVLTVTVNAGTKKAQWKESTGGVDDSYYNFAISNDSTVEDANRDVVLGMNNEAKGHQYTNTQGNTFENPALAFGYGASAHTVNTDETDEADSGIALAIGQYAEAYGHNQISLGYKSYAGGHGGNFVFGNASTYESGMPWSEKLLAAKYNGKFGSFGKTNENFIVSSIVDGNYIGTSNHNYAFGRSYLDSVNRCFAWFGACVDEASEPKDNSGVVAENIIMGNSIILYDSSDIGTVGKNTLFDNGCIKQTNKGYACQNFLVGGAVYIDNSTAIGNNNVLLCPGESFENISKISELNTKLEASKTICTGSTNPWGSQDIPMAYNSNKVVMIHDNWTNSVNTAFILGENNLCKSGTNYTIIGDGNYIINNNNAYILGLANRINGHASNYVIGQNNLLTYCDNCFAIGVLNSATGTSDTNKVSDSINIGLGLIGNSYQIIVGKYNKKIDNYSDRTKKAEETDQDKQAIFIVGNGKQKSAESDHTGSKASDLAINESGIERSNAMVVYQDGHAEFSGDVVSKVNNIEHKLSAKLDKTRSYTYNTYTTEDNDTFLERDTTILAESIVDTDYIFGSIVLNIATTSDNPVNLSLVPMYKDDVEVNHRAVSKRDDYDYSNHSNRCCVHIPAITASQILTIPFMFNNHTINSTQLMTAIAIKGASNYSADTVSIVSCTYSYE